MNTKVNANLVEKITTSLDVNSPNELNAITKITTDKILETSVNAKVYNKLDLGTEAFTIKRIKLDVEVGGSARSTNNHANLKNLDFESSGHIGFASEFALGELENKVVPRRLNEFTIAKGKPSNQYIFVDNNGEDSKLSVKEINSRVLKTVSSIPDDMEEGEYIFLKI